MQREEEVKEILEAYKKLISEEVREEVLGGMRSELETFTDTEVSVFLSLLRKGYMPVEGESVCKNDKHDAPTKPMTVMETDCTPPTYAVMAGEQVIYLSFHDMVHFHMLMRSEGVSNMLLEAVIRTLLHNTSDNEGRAQA